MTYFYRHNIILALSMYDDISHVILINNYVPGVTKSSHVPDMTNISHVPNKPSSTHAPDMSNSSYVLDMSNYSHVQNLNMTSVSSVPSMKTSSHIGDLTNSSHVPNMTDSSHVPNMTDSSHVPDMRNASTNQSHPVLLVCSFRSGSSFLGELLANAPNAFYVFEPLFPILTSIYGIRISPMRDFYDNGTFVWVLSKLWHNCKIDWVNCDTTVK